MFSFSRLRYFLLLGLTCLTCPIAYAQATHVQTNWTWNSGTTGGTASSAISQTNTFGSNNTTGNLIVVHISYSGQTKNISTVTDSKSNTYTRINGPTNWGGAGYYRSELWYAYNITGGVKLTITVTASGSTPMTTSSDGLQFIQIYASEFSGITTTNPLDQNSVATTSTKPFNSGAVTTTYTNELVYGAAIGGSMPAITAGSAFNSISSTNSNRVEYVNVSVANSYNADFSSSGNGTAVADMATFKSTTSVLPIQLIGFSATNNNDVVDLEWKTATEINNDYFEVQRSIDGEHWSAIEKVEGRGNSTEINEYFYSDHSPASGLNYYRLNQVDFDGHHALSPVIVIQHGWIDQGITISPNPVDDWVNVTGADIQTQSVALFNSMGECMNNSIKEVKQIDSGVSLNLKTLPSGVYIVKTMQHAVRILKK